MKVMTIVGARPQFVKAAAVSRAFSVHRPDVKEIIVHTGQHYDANMSEVFFGEMQIPRPHRNLNVGGGTHGQNTGRMLERLEQLVFEFVPDWMLVFGDTDSTLAGAITAAKCHVPLAHVEAGLRSFNRKMPEEINRVLADHVSQLLFAPTETARQNLLSEGIDAARVHAFGDVMYDAAIYYRDRARAPIWLGEMQLRAGRFALCTIHRAENTDVDRNLDGILEGLSTAGLPIVLPLHPRTRGRMLERGLTWPDNVHVVDPVGYLEMVWLEANCALVLTDSGGVQKEAFIHGKPCITLRRETEWVELVASGWNRLVGSDAEAIAHAIVTTRTPDQRPEFYGRGDAAERIVKAIE